MAQGKTTKKPAKRERKIVDKAVQLLGDVVNSSLVKAAAATALAGAAQALAQKKGSTLSGAAQGAVEAVTDTAATAVRQVGADLTGVGARVGGAVGESLGAGEGAAPAGSGRQKPRQAVSHATAGDKPKAGAARKRAATKKKPKKTAKP